jgi:hypothetical protein
MDKLIISADLKNPENINIKSDLDRSTDCLNDTIKMVETTGARIISSDQTKEFDPNQKNPAFVNVK